MIRGAVDRGGDETSNDGGSPQRPCRTGGSVPRSGDRGGGGGQGYGVLLGFGSARCATHHPHERDRPNRYPAPRKIFGPGLSKPPGPFVADSGNRQRTGAETKR